MTNEAIAHLRQGLEALSAERMQVFGPNAKAA